MSDLRTTCEETLEAIHAALDRGDVAAADARCVGPIGDGSFLRKFLPRPGASPFVGVSAVDTRKAIYAVRDDGDDAMLRLTKLFHGRDGVWRVEPSGQGTGIARGETPGAALARYIEMFGRDHVPPKGSRKWAPVPRKPTPLADILWIGLTRNGVPASVVDDAERALDARFPDGYREYVTRFGEAVDSGFLRVYPPARVVRELSEWRLRIDAYWFWAPARDGAGRELGQDQAYESIPIADTMNGDELIFHPARPGGLFVLPRHIHEVAFVAGGFTEAIAWMTEASDLELRTKMRWATVLHGQRPRTFRGEEDDADDESTEAGEEAVAALRALDPTSRVEQADDEDGGWTVLLPRFGASAFVFSYGDVSLTLDAHTPQDLLDEIEGALADLGLESDDE
jgi:hypothetical protein